MNDISVMAVSLATLATLALLEFLGCRAPIRDGLVTACGWLRAKLLALRSEARLFVAWMFQPDRIVVNAEDIDWVEFPLTPDAGKSDEYTYRVTWDDGEEAAPKPRKRAKPKTRKRGK